MWRALMACVAFRASRCCWARSRASSPIYYSTLGAGRRIKKPITQGAELIVEPVEAVTHCEACGRDYATVEHGKTCPHCGSGETYLLQGQEVMIKQIETPDEDPADAAPDGLSDAPDAVDAANPLHIA